MKALVLGGTQFMGIHLVNQLISAGHDVTIATRGNNPDPFGDKVKRLKIDRQNSDTLREAFKGKSYDITIDNIAYSSNEIKFLLDVLQTGKYVMTSSCAVYSKHLHDNIKEEEFDPKTHPLNWCDYSGTPYDEAKRQAETALYQAYPNQLSVAVRFPYIFGKDDYTKRLFFYVDHVFHEKPMYVDNPDSKLSFIDSVEAGQFLFHAATGPVEGPINPCSNGLITLGEVIAYTEKVSGKKAVLQPDGNPGTLNSVPNLGMDTTKATKSGFKFMNINDWVYPLITFWVAEFSRK